MLAVNKVHQGDALEVLHQLPDDSIDLIVTDPPYGLHFMGLDFDKAVPPVEIWRECVRVLKPGAFAFIMSGPRQDVLARMIVRLGDAGFETRFSALFHTFATGFPKAMNMAKAVMKRIGDPGEVVGTEKIDVGIQGGSMHAGRSSKVVERPILQPTDPRAKSLQGSYAGFAPKPAVEVVLVAMKPLSEDTYVDQAMKNSKGVTWLDGGRVPFASQVDARTAHENALGPVERYDPETRHPIYGGGRKSTGFADTHRPEGRFPANLLVSDHALDDGGIHRTGHMDAGTKRANRSGYTGDMPEVTGRESVADEGSFSRYFDLDRWWEERIKKLPKAVQKVFPFFIVPKASSSERNEGLGDLPEQTKVFNGQSNKSSKNIKDVENRFTTTTKNIHPTVKPVKLLAYLITIGSREGDIVLDPFIGSGTTGIAAIGLARKFIGIELNPDYAKIAEERLKPMLRTTHLDSFGGE